MLIACDICRTFRRQSLADEVIARLRGLMLKGTLKAGDKSPAERELAECFGVGRSVVREAIYKLEFSGLLQTKPQGDTVIEIDLLFHIRIAEATGNMALQSLIRV